MANIQIESSTPLAETFEPNRSHPPKRHNKRRRYTIQSKHIVYSTHNILSSLVIVFIK